MASSLRPSHDQAIVIPRPDLHAEAAGIWDPDCNGVIETKQWGPVKINCPLSYRIPSRRNTFGFVQVDSVGEGTHRGAGLDQPEVQPGDIVGVDLCQVGHSLAHGGKEKWFVPYKEFLCKFDPANLENPQPLMNYVMTEYSEEMMNHLTFKDQGTALIAAPSSNAKGLLTNSNSRSNVRIAVEKVLGVGAGRFVNRVWTEARCQVGDGVIFMPTNATVDMLLRGPRRRFTPWSEIEGVLTVNE